MPSSFESPAGFQERGNTGPYNIPKCSMLIQEESIVLY
jgi:hypothetical protein